MPKKILTIDDSKTLRSIVSRTLKPLGFQVLEASNGIEGLNIAWQERPDLVILDITMPVMDGIETLTKMKKDPQLSRIPILMLTAVADQQTVLKIASLGVKEYLVKPFDDEELIKRVNKLIEGIPEWEKAQQQLRERKTILVVDDKSHVRELVRQLLEGRYEILEATNGAEGVSLAMKESPDLILMDMDMPVMDGFEAIQRLRGLDQTREVKVLAMTIKTNFEEQRRALDAGCDGLVFKPFTKDLLLKKIESLLASSDEVQIWSEKEDILFINLPTKMSTSALNKIGDQICVRLLQLVDEGKDKMVVNMEKTQQITREVIEFLNALIQEAEKLGVRVSFVVPSQKIRDRLAEFHETRYVETFATEEEAMEKFAED